MIILDLCAGSGGWSQPYLDKGYTVKRFDLSNDIRLIHKLNVEVQGILCAPPCTMFAASGSRWHRTEAQMLDALSVVDACLRAVAIYNPQWWALENPIGKLVRWLGPPRMYFDPNNYGDPYLKRTCLWGNFNEPKMTPVTAVDKSPIHYMSPSPERIAMRSITPPGFAKAFCDANP
jgi:hypothetical protein